MTERWRSLPPGGRALAVLVAVVVVLQVVFVGLDRVGGGDRSAPPGSSYGDAGDGLSAWSTLLERSGHEVRQVRTALADADLVPGSTLVVAGDASGDPDVVDWSERLLDSGGRLVLVGPEAALLLPPGGPVWSPVGPDASHRLGPSPEVARAETVLGEGLGAWTRTGPLLPVLGGVGRSTVAVGELAGGRIVAVADPTLLTNAHLAEADNAALAVDLVGPVGRPVAFLETVHGYGGSSGLWAAPWRWRWMAAGLLLAAVVAMWGRAKRLGPPQDPTRPLPPPRAQAVDALAATLVRTRDQGVVAEDLRAVVRSRLAERGGLGADPDRRALAEAASAAGLSDDQVAAVLGSTDDPEVLLAVGAALAHVHQEDR